MALWNAADILKLDAGYAAGGIALHARPLRAAMDIFGSQFVIGVFSNPETQKIVAAYEALVPEVSTTWPGFGIGIVASVDRVRKVTLGVAMGSGQPKLVWQILGFQSQHEFAVWCRGDTSIRDEATLAATDMLDFAYGLNKIKGQKPEALTLWHQARSNIEDIANILPQTFSVDTVIQQICMTVELSLKAQLVWDGAELASFKGQKGHALKDIAFKAMASRPHLDDKRFLAVIAALPPYVATRYSPPGLTRLHVVQLALGAQFVAASTLRRVTGIDTPDP